MIIKSINHLKISNKKSFAAATLMLCLFFSFLTIQNVSSEPIYDSDLVESEVSTTDFGFENNISSKVFFIEIEENEEDTKREVKENSDLNQSGFRSPIYPLQLFLHVDGSSFNNEVVFSNDSELYILFHCLKVHLG
ncbi:hypothetical protein SAMN00777080_0735 [Aquiflexum balticum DSM 16537]|uniref:Uncharacterized protein n=1 Tax=Aquiflexum balticum DSM 16537 TaxID=758820 RepID=A0A1W2GZT0_9BACT|nr:hypothetical protein [Aquiflexum balticum]SMD42195.1 hypothetical protein SAMN00777080_0735 [Aquiflexum balticum DSM 16537]